jgi:hypothetical protein
MIAIGNNLVNSIIQLDPNLFEGNIGYFKIAETSHLEEEGNQRTLALLCTGGVIMLIMKMPLYSVICVYIGEE